MYRVCIKSMAIEENWARLKKMKLSERVKIIIVWVQVVAGSSDGKTLIGAEIVL